MRNLTDKELEQVSGAGPSSFSISSSSVLGNGFSFSFERVENGVVKESGGGSSNGSGGFDLDAIRREAFARFGF